jgi:hypothetical protein
MVAPAVLALVACGRGEGGGSKITTSSAAAAPGEGIIVAERPVLIRRTGDTGDSIAPRTILYALGDHSGASAATGLIEFVVLTTAGQTISVVQDTEQNLHAGDRVAIIRGDHTRLVRMSKPATVPGT